MELEGQQQLELPHTLELAEPRKLKLWLEPRPLELEVQQELEVEQTLEPRMELLPLELEAQQEMELLPLELPPTLEL